MEFLGCELATCTSFGICDKKHFQTHGRVRCVSIYMFKLIEFSNFERGAMPVDQPCKPKRQKLGCA